MLSLSFLEFRERIIDIKYVVYVSARKQNIFYYSTIPTGTWDDLRYFQKSILGTSMIRPVRYVLVQFDAIVCIATSLCPCMFHPWKSRVFKTPLPWTLRSRTFHPPKKDGFSKFCSLFFLEKIKKHIVKLKELWFFLDLYDNSNGTEHMQWKNDFSDQMYQLVGYRTLHTVRHTQQNSTYPWVNRSFALN